MEKKIKMVGVKIKISELITLDDLIEDEFKERYNMVKDKAEKYNCDACIVDKPNFIFMYESTVDRDAFYNEIKDAIKTAELVNELYAVIDSEKFDA